jgi:glycosyltransferase involved in cell wall biosynthesis
MKTLIVIPAFNEQASIADLVREITGYGYDYLVINDCSTDHTPAILDEGKFNHLDLPVNLGLAGVTRAGFMYAADQGYDCVLCIDGDGQHPPKYMKELIDEVENGYDYVLGSRFIEEKKPLTMRMLGSRLLCLLIRLKSGKKVTDPTSGMRALGRKVIETFADSMNFYAEPDALCYLLHHGFSVKEVPVEMKERDGGVSYFANPLKSVYFMLAEILSIVFIQ